MSEYGDDYYDDDDDDWIYMEEHWDEAVSQSSSPYSSSGPSGALRRGAGVGHADLVTSPQNDLAEHTCPSPVISVSPRQEEDAYDCFDFWEDLEYLSDGVYDTSKSTSEKGIDRKRKAKARTSEQPRKRPRLQPSIAKKTQDLVVWRSQTERAEEARSVCAERQKDGSSVALLKDWERRFSGADGFQNWPIKQELLVPAEPAEAEDSDCFDVSDLRSVAKLLSGENMEALQNMLEAKGLDPTAIEEVLEDMANGDEPEFNEDAETEPEVSPGPLTEVEEGSVEEELFEPIHEASTQDLQRSDGKRQKRKRADVEPFADSGFESNNSIKKRWVRPTKSNNAAESTLASTLATDRTTKKEHVGGVEEEARFDAAEPPERRTRAGRRRR